MKCTECKAYRKCRRRSIAKGSKMCDINRGLTGKSQVNKQKAAQQDGALLWGLLQHAKNK